MPRAWTYDDIDRIRDVVNERIKTDWALMGMLTAEDLLKAARVLFREAALLSRQARRPAPEGATVGMVEEGA